MVNSKSAKPNSSDPTPNHRVSLQQLLWFVIVSILVHGLGLLMFALYQRSQPVTEEESKPIEFVVVPEETEAEPPPETENRAIENSVAEQEIESEAIAEDTTTTPPPAPPQSLVEDNPEPEVAATQPAPPAPAAPPEPVAESEPEPTPPAAPPEPVAESEPEPTPPAAPLEPIAEPTPEPEPAPAPEANTSNEQPVLSGSDAATPAPEPPPESNSEPEVATRLPPTTQSEPAPTNNPNGSAEDLLGGDYQRTLANGGGDAFFSPEALAYESVLNPSQIDALKDIDLGPYFDEVKRRVKRNWNPSSRTEEYTTFLTFDIEKKGQITGLRGTQSSGSPQVDRESLAAVENSAPFAPLPPDFPLESLGVRFSFNIYIY